MTDELDGIAENHRVIIYRDSKIWVCCGHCCNMDGVLAVK